MNKPPPKHPLIIRRLYRNYRAYSGMMRWYSRKFTPTGKLVVLGLVVTACLGVDTNRTVAYQAFAFLAALFTLSALAGRFPRPKFSLSRTLPRYGTAGEPLDYTVTVENLQPTLQRSLRYVDDLADPRPSIDVFASTPEPKEKTRNFVDRFFKFHRWMWLIERNTRGSVEERDLPTAPPLGQTEVRLQLKPTRRGSLRIENGTVACPDPFGICRRLVKIPKADKILILPRRYPLPDFDLPGSMRYQQGGVALASSVGESEEFASLREYRHGDPQRRIHWKSWAKVGRPIVKEFQAEFFVRHALILDTFSEGAHSEAFEEAVTVASSLACAIDTQDCLLDLLFVGPKAYCFTAGRGVAHSEQMLEILASVETCPGKPFEDLDDMVVRHAAAVSGCVCVFIRWDEARRRLVDKLRGMNVPVMILLIREQGAESVDREAISLGPEDAFHELEVGAVEEGLARL